MAGHEDILGLIYATAGDAALWLELLERFSRLTGGHAAALRAYDLTGAGGQLPLALNDQLPATTARLAIIPRRSPCQAPVIFPKLQLPARS